MAPSIPDDPLLAAFANVLRRRRQQLGLTQEELAHRAGLSMRYVSLLESRRHVPSLATLKALSDALGLRLGALAGEVEAEADRATPAKQAGSGETERTGK